MGYVRFEKDWRYHGCRVLRMESDLLRIDILPELGGKIYRWIHKPEDRDYLWQHPRIKPAILPAGTHYDDNFCGGWDELFPSGGPVTHAGETYPDHGEYWTQRFDWEAQQSGSELTLYLRAEGPVTPTRMERWITISASSRSVRIRHRLTHLGRNSFDYLWAMHPALRVSPSCQLLLPASKALIAAPAGGRLSETGQAFDWPMAPARGGGTVDLSQIPADGGPGYEMVYLNDLQGAWCGILDHATRSGFGLAFDGSLFNSIWAFQTHGGWRGLHTAILEPATGRPYDLGEAAAAGTCARLAPGQVVESRMAAVVFTDREQVRGITPDGDIR